MDISLEALSNVLGLYLVHVPHSNELHFKEKWLTLALLDILSLVCMRLLGLCGVLRSFCWFIE